MRERRIIMPHFNLSSNQGWSTLPLKSIYVLGVCNIASIGSAREIEGEFKERQGSGE